MRIGIDCRMMGSKQAGLGRYVEQLVLGLAKNDGDNEYVLYVRTTKDFPFDRLRAGENTNYELPSNFYVVEANIPWYSWQEQIGFKKLIDKENLDLMHFPHWNVPLFYNKPFVVTVHDLIMYHYPRQEASTHGPIVYWFKDMVHRLVLRHAVRKAKHIMVTSEFTKQDVHETLGVPLDKMTVVYQAPNHVSHNTYHISHELLPVNSSILQKFGITKKFVLYVGNAYPHKNLGGLLKAWKIFEEKYGNEYQLVLVGKKNYFYDSIKYKVESIKSIIFTGYASDEELAVLYSNASLYVFPSLYEGFGLPPLEAQQYNVPVVSSNSSCLPEILGESALYFDPENYEQMADVIQIGLTDENIRFELQNNARENLKRFSYKQFAKVTLEIYKKTAKCL